jgi:hypothetical protein
MPGVVTKVRLKLENGTMVKLFEFVSEVGEVG